MSDREQRAVDAQIGPVLALAERAHERGRLAGAERHPQRVGGLKARGGLLGGELLGHGASQPRRVTAETTGLSMSGTLWSAAARLLTSAGAPSIKIGSRVTTAVGIAADGVWFVEHR